MLKLLSKFLAIFMVISWLSIFFLRAQIPTNDTDLISKKPEYPPFQMSNKVEYMFAGRSAFIKYNPVSMFFGGLMYFYQKVVSPQFSSSCLYIPSCSNFSKMAISEFGLVKGICLSADRLTRCSRLGLTDIHHHCFDPETGKVHEHMDMFKF